MTPERLRTGSSGPIGSDSPDCPSAGASPRFFRADLHVHSCYSGPGHHRGRGVHTGVGTPERIYQIARARGMDLVTLTDCDTIEGCLRFRERNPEARDFIISVEVTAVHPHMRQPLQVLLFDLDEDQHRDAQRLRGDVRELMAYVRQADIPASLSPSLRGLAADAWALQEAEEMLGLFDRFEVKNGALGRAHNNLAARLIERAGGARRPGLTGGSCAHGPARVGRTVTVSLAGSVGEFLADLRAGRTWASGEDGSVWSSSSDLSRLIAHGYHGLLLRAPGEARGAERRLASALLALPLHLMGAPFWGHGLRRARAAARLRSARRRLDRLDLMRFQEKARSYAPAIATGGAGAVATVGRAGMSQDPFRTPGSP